MRKRRNKFALCLVKSTLVLALGLGCVGAHAAPPDSPPTVSGERDGQHDFDFLFGRWQVHLNRKTEGTDKWAASDGYAVYRKIWGGRANLNEFYTDGAAGQVEGLTLRTYNPETHRWSLYWANSRDGILSSPQVGKFNHGQGEFYELDNSDGNGVLVRYVWSGVTAHTAHFEQALSEDGGKTWDVNWVSDMKRLGDAEEATPSSAKSSNAGSASVDSGERDFEPLLGRWNYLLKRRSKPLTGSIQWTDIAATGECMPLWRGRAQLDTLAASNGSLEGLTLRLFNPKTREWRLYWANGRDGLVAAPQIGRFKAAHGEFYAQDTLDGSSILVKFDWSGLDTKSPHFEQSFSNDGGKQWEVNWVTDQTRATD
jgi:hypothetical protein